MVMMKMLLGGFVVFCFLSGCGSAPEDSEPAKEVSSVRLAGRVQRVNKTSGFVLIRRYGIWRVGEHEVVVSRGEGRSANLLPTGETLGEHIAADIRSGEIEVGDAVYIRQILEKLTSKEAEPSEKPENITPLEN